MTIVVLNNLVRCLDSSLIELPTFNIRKGKTMSILQTHSLQKQYIMGQVVVNALRDVDFVVEDYTDYRQNKGKEKHAKCKKCKYYKVCEGPWRDYPAIYGWDEFKPV